ncbi:hypothetical protein [Mitsuokella jalaludinii]
MRQYLRTPKGAFDARDYLRAIACMAVSAAAAACLLNWILEG